MYRIAICDDDENDGRSAAGYIKAFFEEKGEDCAITCFSAMTDLLEEEAPYDLYLLDVLMPEKSGIEGAADLRSRLKGDPLIVFITSSLDSAVEGYQVNASGFILKPIDPQKFKDTMERVYTRHLKAIPATLSVTHNRLPLEIPVAQIVSIESRLHQTHINLTGGRSIRLGLKLSELEERLRPYPHFIRCHQSFVINLRFVKELDSSCFVMEDGRQIPISRAYYKQSKYDYYRYYLK